MVSVCFYLVGLILTAQVDNPSPSYRGKFIRTQMSDRVSNCLLVARIAEEENFNTPTLLAIAAVESGFVRGLVSRAGAKSLIGVMPGNLTCTKCTEKEMILEGIKVLDDFAEDNRHYGPPKTDCEWFARYNGGWRRKCNVYGRKVIYYRQKLCELPRFWDVCGAC